MNKQLFVIIVLLVLTFGSAQQAAAAKTIELKPLGTFATGFFDEGATEIVAHDPETQRLFTTNGFARTIDVLDISDPSNLSLLFSIDLSPYGKSANSVAVDRGVVAAAVENIEKQEPGRVVFFDTDGNFLNQVIVGALPDMITFSPNGSWVLVANEGEPNDDYTIDPEGSVSIIDMRAGVAAVTQVSVRTADFTAFSGAALDPSIRIFGPGATVAQDIEPEYIAVSHNSKTAWVTLQENNAIAVIDIREAAVTELLGLGFKDHSVAGNALDASNRDGGVNIRNWPVKGMYLPDSIATIRYRGETLIITANEGDSRDYPGFSEETRIKDLVLDTAAFPDAAYLQMEENLGRLKTTVTKGDLDGDGDYDELYSYGARSFSIWTSEGALLFDSGDELECITAAAYPNDFNSTNDENWSFDDRSDDKGPEPEGLAVGSAFGSSYVFVGLERIGGIAVYNLTLPGAPEFVQYINTRTFNVDAAAPEAGDLAPEGLTFIKAEESPTDNPLLVVAFEVSGTITVFEVAKKDIP